MAFQQNGVAFDTCEGETPRDWCRVQFEIDVDLPSDQQDASIKLVSVDHKCKAHAHLSDQEAFDQAWQENRDRNNAAGAILEAVPELICTLTPEEKRQLRLMARLHGLDPAIVPDKLPEPDMNVLVKFDAQRKLVLEHSGLTGKQVADAVAAVHAKVGAAIKF